MNTIFKDKKLDERLTTHGYLKIPLLTPALTQQLLELYHSSVKGEQVKNSKYGLYVTLEEFDTAKSLEIENTVEQLISDQLDQYFEPHKTHLGGYLIKNPDPNGYTYPHQDWTFVDHSQYRSVTVWIALMPITKENSTLGFARNSMATFNYPVGTPVTIMKSGTTGHEFALYEYLEFIDIQPGEAFVFDNRIVHAATPNTSLHSRIAYALTLSPPSASLVHYLYGRNQKGENDIIQLAVDKAFFHNYTIDHADELYERNELPKGYKVLSREKPTWSPMPASAIETYLLENQLTKNGLSISYHDTNPATQKASLANRIKKWIPWKK
ncbi:phytanoyl-CoA dioxygenase family protein [Marinoscillum sp.]|uniref:phytanoyl-CoA dioxygenase family protein n=1 Tax=Marinoscillum sp. TaxID=2024838 RepID=UPI003BA88335